MPSPRLWLHSFAEGQTKPVDPYGEAQAARYRAARLAVAALCHLNGLLNEVLGVVLK
jgi:hypothetical protein